MDDKAEYDIISLIWINIKEEKGCEDKLDWCALSRRWDPGAGASASGKLADRDNTDCGWDIIFNQEVKL